MIYVAAKLGGRCANGFERGQGSRVHAHQDIEELRRNGYVMAPAVCGQKAGGRSVGWCKVSLEVNCPRCLKIIDSTELLEEQESGYNQMIGESLGLR